MVCLLIYNYFINKTIKGNPVLAQINTISAYLWFVSVIVFSVSIFTQTFGWFGHESCTWLPDCGDNKLLVWTLISLGLGILSFIVMLISGILRKVLKGQKWNAPFRIGAGKISILAIFVLMISLAYFVIMGRMVQGTDSTLDGQHIWDAVNVYRKENGVSELQQNELLCNNLVARWKQFNEENNHDGFEPWLKEYVYPFDTSHKLKSVAEDYVGGIKTAAGAIVKWKESPGHNLSLLDPKYNIGCAYAGTIPGTGGIDTDYGTAIIILGELQK